MLRRENNRADASFVSRAVPAMAATASASEIAAEIHNRLQSLPVMNAPNVRGVRRAFSQALRREDGRLVTEVATDLRLQYGYRSVPYELILAHRGASGC